MTSIADSLVDKQRQAEFDLVARIMTCADEARASLAWWRGDSFIDARLGELWSGMIAGADPVYLAYKGDADLAGDLMRRNAELPWNVQVSALAKVVEDCTLLRRAEAQAQRVMLEIVAGNVEAVQAEVSALSAIDLGRKEMPGKTIKQIGEDFKRAVHEPKGLALRTGIRLLDDAIGGMFPGDIMILASRPGVGKTALAAQIGRNVARDERVNFFSLEMQPRQLIARMACPRAGLLWSDVRLGLATPEQLEMLDAATDEVAAEMMDSNMVIFDSEEDDIRTVADIHRACIKRPANLVIVDLLGEIEWFDSRVEESKWYGPAVKYLRTRIAKKMDVPVLLLHHINRSPEARQDHHPSLSDLRMSGDVEGKSDVVLLAYRDDLYAGRPAGTINVPFEIDPAKNRQGVSGTKVILNYNLREQVFS